MSEVDLEEPVDDGKGRMVATIADLNSYEGETLEEKVDSVISSHGVVIFSKTFCPFCLDVKDFLTRQGVHVTSLEVNVHPGGTFIHKYIKTKYKHNTVPAVFIKGRFIGGCDDVKALHTKDELEELIHDLITNPRVSGASQLETVQLLATDRGEARHPLFWFPNTVDNHVVRLVGVQICVTCIITATFLNESWAPWVSAAMLADYTIRFFAGSSLSPLGAIGIALMAPFKPQYRPGAAKQFAASIGLLFTLVSTCCFFTDHEVVGAVVLAVLAVFAAIEGFAGICVACEFFMLGIQYGLIPTSVYRIHTSTRQELKETWAYKFLNSGAPRPVEVDTNPSSKIALKYKKKTDEWTKDDWSLVRNMKPCYFAIPLAFSGLATAFKIASSWGDMFRGRQDSSTIVVPDEWYQVIATIAACFYVILLVLFFARLSLYPKKCLVEWRCPQRSPSYGAITITLMMFSFLLYDEIDYEESLDGEDKPTQKVARVFFWVGALVHTVLTIAKFAEWTGIRMEFEHVHPQWIIYPVGLAVASLVSVIVPMFEDSENDSQNALLGRFFLSFAYLMWIALFSVTFFKVVTGHNSDPRFHHGIWVWLAAPCVIGLADFAVCAKEQVGIGAMDVCERNFSTYYFIGIFFFLSFIWMSFPYIGFLGRDHFNKGYWMDCFCMDTLAACAALFYDLNNFQASRTLMLIALTVASICHMVALMHTIAALIHRRTFFTPMDKWGPLSFFKLTHEAFRGAIPKLERSLRSIDLENSSGQNQLELFAANYSRFVTLHVEHAKHEDQVVFKTFNDFFPGHGNEYTDDHEEDRVLMEQMRVSTNKLLDTSLPLEERKVILSELQTQLPAFFTDFLEHIRGEEDNLQPIGRKYMSLELQKQMSRECFCLTTAPNWEIVIPYVLHNLPRQLQRIRYLKALCWSMPERSQQFGAIVYRNVDAVLWERLRLDIPEMIPRGEYNYRRYY